MIRLKFLAALAIIAGSAFAEPVTADRVDAVPATDQNAWKDYLQRSQAAAAADQAALQAELVANGLTTALPAPDGGDFKLPAKPRDIWYVSEEAKQLAETILSYQTPSGGWSKHTGYTKGPRKPGMLWSSQYVPGAAPHYLATFDNRSTTEQLSFLAYAWEATQREEYKAAFVKGLNYVLDAQYPNGGWPQVYPLEGGYHDDITFNDDAMTHILTLLQDIEAGASCYTFLDPAQRARVSKALALGIECVLSLQIQQDGKKVVWCAQYDAITRQPASARKMEPATLSGAESARILEFLMRIQKPSPEIVASVESGLKWFEQAKITGMIRTKVDEKTTYIADPASTEIYWARFYDLTTGKPIFPGRDGVIYETYAEMAAKNKLGYDYYTTQPGSLLNTGQKKWRKALAKPS